MKNKPKNDNQSEVTELLNELDLQPDTLNYLIDIKEDTQYFLDELSSVGNLIVTKAADMGETRWSCNMSPEMQALFLLSFFKGLIETMMPEKLKDERQEWRNKFVEKYQSRVDKSSL